ncbi:AAA family ATPase [Cellulomonas sp. P22]|uniref:AAA family ATPase n=1 Tax=Cellulomonas sp. P22 TaxID=3373189 RepID=UPI00378EB258
MHLRTLELQAIGPFAGSFTIDFAALGASGLFLLEGPTGAGKSTIIDAIVFALYGKVASPSASEDRLRSAFAPEHVESLVDLVFETGAGVFRVRRTPAYDRPKKRGHGTVRQQSSVKLWRLPADLDADPGADGGPVGEILSTRPDEAGAELQRIIGLDRTQFVQTIVLPQGEFASFLRADPEHRRSLLQKIFGTEVYERVQQRLEEMRREVQRAVSDARGDLRSAAAHFAGAASLDVEAARALEEAADEGSTQAVELAQGHVDHLAEVADRLEVQRVAADAALEEARREVDRLTGTVAALARRADLRAEQQRLDELAGTHREDVERYERARRALAVRALVHGLDSAEAALAAAEEAVRVAVDDAPEDLLPPQTRAFGLLGHRPQQLPGDEDADPGRVSVQLRETLTAERSRAERTAATLTRLVVLESELPDRHRAVRDLRLSVDSARTEAQRLAVELTSRPAERADLVAELATATELVSELGARRAEQRAAEAVLAAAGVAERTAEELATAVPARDAAAAAAHRAVEHEARARDARIAGIAGELAGGLAPGEPCPVCGAREHPAKADHAEDRTSPEDVDRATHERAHAEEVLAERAAEVVALTERLAGAREGAGGLSLEEARSRVAEARILVTMAESGEAARARALDALAVHDEETEIARGRRGELEQLAAAEQARLASLEAELERDSQEVAEARDDHPTVQARQRALARRTAAATRVIDALAEVDRASRDRDVRVAELTRGLEEQGFFEVDDARASLLDPPVLAELEATVRAHQAAVERVRTGLADPALADLPDDAEDADALGSQLAAARALHVERRELAARITGAVTIAAERVALARASLAQVVAASTALGTALADAAPVVRMAGLAAAAGGDNARALTLATYVLVRRFEDVVAAANERLLLMSDGRFELVRSDEREDVRSRRTGLSMRVVDHRTETARDPRTLSGGETFYVSLCLALGMADVVTAEAGGIDLGTLFVDEGFGSLDPHTLDAVLAELGRLRAGGRVVGVVSHVEALKASIAERIEVRRLPDGSSTLAVRAG